MVMNTLKNPTQKFEQFWMMHGSEKSVARMDFYELLDDVIDIIEDAEGQLNDKDVECDELSYKVGRLEKEIRELELQMEGLSDATYLQEQVDAHEKLNGTLQATVERQNKSIEELKRVRDQQKEALALKTSQLEEAETAAAGVLDEVKKSYEAEITKLKRALHADQNAVSIW